MKIDGKAIAHEIFQKLQQDIATLKDKNTTPHLAIILVGDNPASVSYVNRKKIKAEEIGAKATIYHFSKETSQEEVLDLIKKLNHDASTQGIIVQRPLPTTYDLAKINEAVIPQKDIDAFHSKTLFDMPLAKAALLLLEFVYSSSEQSESRSKSDMFSASSNSNTDFRTWMKEKHITVIGKGETGGGPIITLLKKYGISPSMIDSHTSHPMDITKKSDIIFSAVGKEKILTKDMIKKGAILISIGQHKQKDGKFHGDYEEENIQDTASWYSPTPGGVGPVNVASLLQNLVKATNHLQQ